MPYNLSYFKSRGMYIEKEIEQSDVDLQGGKIIKNLPQKIKDQLLTHGGTTHGGDYSRQDSAIITAMLSHGLSPEDTYTTFASSPRGRHAAKRKEGHLDDYLSRTIRKSVSFLGNGKSTKDHVSVDFSRKRPDPEGEGIITQKANEVEIETPQWLWPGYIPAGKITILAGDPGLGKSTIALDLVSRISRGTLLPLGGKRTVSGTCLVASAEDAPEDTIVPRLVASSANLKRIEIMRQVKIDDEIMYLSFPRDLQMLRDSIRQRGARMAVIDPFNAFLGKDTDSYKDQDIRLVLAPFEDIAEETGAAILIVAHLNKKETASMLYRVGGSIGLIGAARSVLAVTNIPNKKTRVLYSLKSNLAKSPAAIEYRTVEVTRDRKDTEAWAGEKIVISSHIRWMGEIDFDPAQLTVTSMGKAEEAAEGFLKQILEDCEVKCDDIFSEAKQAGLSRSQLMRVRTELGIKSIKKGAHWYWKWTS